MTNMHDHEIDRIIRMHISPINISVHTTNPELRSKMLVNRRGRGRPSSTCTAWWEAGIAVNCQLVLCRGVNDGDELRRTLTDLLALGPHGPEHRGGALRHHRLPAGAVPPGAL